jgi:hypothetical protein
MSDGLTAPVGAGNLGVGGTGCAESEGVIRRLWLLCWISLLPSISLLLTMVSSAEGWNSEIGLLESVGNEKCIRALLLKIFPHGPALFQN